MNPVVVIAVIGGIISAVVGLGGLASMVWAVGKVKGLELTVEVFRTGNEGLRGEIADRDRRHAAELVRLTSEQRANEVAAAERISRLEGANDALVNGIADKLAVSIGDRIESAITGAVDRLSITLSTTPTPTVGAPMKESTRAWIYRTLVAAVPLVQAYGIVNEQTAALWIGLAGAVLGVGLAAKNTSTKP